MPVIDLASVALIRPATTAHSPSRTRTLDSSLRVPITGIPLLESPVRVLNSADTSSETSSVP